MDLGFFRGRWELDSYFFIKYGDNIYTDGWSDELVFDAITKVFIGYKNEQAYHNDGSYVDTTLLIPLSILTFNNED